MAEVTPVFRGCVFKPKSKAVMLMVEEQFGFAAMQVVSFADLFAANWWRPWTGSIQEICSTSTTCCRTME